MFAPGQTPFETHSRLRGDTASLDRSSGRTGFVQFSVRPEERPSLSKARLEGLVGVSNV